MMRRLLCVASLLLVSCSGVSQTGTVAHKATLPSLPTDPQALLALGAASNGLAHSRLRNWMLTAHYELYDAHGLRKESGIFQEYWAGPDDYRLHFARNSYHLDAWVTPKGSFYKGDPNLPATERLLYRWLMEPIPNHIRTGGYDLRHRVLLFPDGAQFPCVQLDVAHPVPDDPEPISPQYCFQKHLPVLFMVDTIDGQRMVYTADAALNGQYLPYRFVSQVGRRPFLSAELIDGEVFRQIPPSILMPPPDAIPGHAPDMTLLYLTSGPELSSHAISTPMLNQIQINSAMQGPVGSLVYSMTIGTDGHVMNLRVITDDAPAIVDDVTTEIKTWRYRPFMANGVAVPVRARVWLNFEKKFAGM